MLLHAYNILCGIVPETPSQVLGQTTHPTDMPPKPQRQALSDPETPRDPNKKRAGRTPAGSGVKDQPQATASQPAPPELSDSTAFPPMEPPRRSPRITAVHVQRGQTTGSIAVAPGTVTAAINAIENDGESSYYGPGPFKIVANKRRGPKDHSSSEDESPTNEPRKKKRAAARPALHPTLTKNRYHLLSDRESEMETDPAPVENEDCPPAPPKAHKIPPVCVKNFSSHKALLTYIHHVTKNFTVTPRRDFSKVQLETIGDYRQLTTNLEKDEIEYYTFSEARPKTQRFVIRGCPANADIQDIQDELTELGIPIKGVTQLRRYTETKQTPEGDKILGEPLPLFAVALQARAPGTTPVDLSKITRLLNCVVYLEAPREVKQQIQMCYRCQSTGHIAEFCKRQPRCVSCGKNHLSATCEVPMTQPATCANCQGQHPANYRGCPYLKNAEARRHTSHPSPGAAQTTSRRPSAPRQRPEQPQRAPAKSVSPGFSFAQAATNQTATGPIPNPPAANVSAAQPTQSEHSLPDASSFANLLASFDWRTMLLSLAKMIANLNLHPALTALAHLVPTFLASSATSNV